jgi:sulfate transport system substrate-binding protein
MGDVLIAWENEALTAAQEMPTGRVELVVPSISILAEPPVALLDQNVDRDGKRQLATAYLEFLYSETGQRIAARHHLRPRLESATATNQFAQLTLFTVDEVFGGWQQAQKIHFANGGIFDQIFTPH